VTVSAATAEKAAAFDFVEIILLPDIVFVITAALEALANSSPETSATPVGTIYPFVGYVVTAALKNCVAADVVTQSVDATAKVPPTKSFIDVLVTLVLAVAAFTFSAVNPVAA
jgi:hypothetical protein